MTESGSVISSVQLFGILGRRLVGGIVPTCITKSVSNLCLTANMIIFYISEYFMAAFYVFYKLPHSYFLDKVIFLTFFSLSQLMFFAIEFIIKNKKIS